MSSSEKTENKYLMLSYWKLSFWIWENNVSTIAFIHYCIDVPIQGKRRGKTNKRQELLERKKILIICREFLYVENSKIQPRNC